MVDGEGLADELGGVGSRLAECADGSTRIVRVPGNETDTGLAQPPRTAPPARAARAPAASTAEPGCRLMI